MRMKILFLNENLLLFEFSDRFFSLNICGKYQGEFTCKIE
jgi:hypothetical protein